MTDDLVKRAKGRLAFLVDRGEIKTPELIVEFIARIEADAETIARLEGERERLALAICGGEDAPGYANAQTVEALEKVARDNAAAAMWQIDRTMKAEAKVAAAKLEVRFWKNCERKGVNDCWPWTGTTMKRDGRGTLFVDGKNVTAPRVAWFVEHGEWPEKDIFVCHDCDNPNCVNVKHLWLGTTTDNMRDAQRKGRLLGQGKTVCKHGHKLEGDNIIWKGKTKRQCLTCKREYQSQYKLTAEQRAQKTLLQRQRRAAIAAAKGGK